MQIARPITVDDAVMTYTNVPEDDAPVWDSQATYAAEDQVIKTSTHRVYESLISSNTDDPEVGVNADPPTWLDVGATRPWRIYDEKVRNVTTALEPMNPVAFTAQDDRETLSLDFVNDEYRIAEMDGIALTLQPNALVDSVALLNISALFAHVKVEDSGGTVYARRTPLSGGMEESTWYAYFYTPIDRQTQLVLTDLPRSLDATIHIALEDLDSPAQLGELVVGRAIGIGTTQYGASVSIIDYSKKERDTFGNLVITERRYTQLAEYPVWIPRSSVDTAYSLLAGLRAEPTLFIGTTEHSSLVVFGVYRDMRITFDNYSFCQATLEVEEI